MPGIKNWPKDEEEKLDIEDVASVLLARWMELHPEDARVIIEVPNLTLEKRLLGNFRVTLERLPDDVQGSA